MHIRELMPGWVRAQASKSWRSDPVEGLDRPADVPSALHEVRGVEPVALDDLDDRAVVRRTDPHMAGPFTYGHAHQAVPGTADVGHLGEVGRGDPLAGQWGSSPTTAGRPPWPCLRRERAADRPGSEAPTAATVLTRGLRRVWP
ncbi:hypothetical protein GCM10010269_13800 [Streptomyces humidus]|uniref:Uncharacterized protein n=1 Tax=Streptomyces humidus TaxID=52259 RepID=A0A918L298_9ACTN|nr:hypothetical protein GCM10010269_13800 [Streptomyces humidus]